MRKTAKQIVSILCCSVLMSGGAGSSFAQVVRGQLSGPLLHTGHASGVLSAAPLGMNPALPGGVSSIKGSLAPTLSAPSAMIPVISPALAAPAALLPVQALVPVAAQPAVPAAISAARALDGALSAAASERRSAAPALNAAFDGFAYQPAASTIDGEGIPGAVPAAESSLASAKTGDLRVVVILDTLNKPAEEGDRLVKSVETLIASGVRVVFVTSRPDKGENSAESMLISKLKVRTGNPIIVVSYNGARISLHNSKAANPKQFLPDQPAFADKTIARFREIIGDVKASLGVKDDVSEFGRPSLESAHIFGGEIPAGIDAAVWIDAVNDAVKAAGFPYMMEAGKNAAGQATFFTQSNSLKLNANRVFNAIYAAAPELDPARGGTGTLKPSQVLVLGDPAKSPGFLSALPGKGHFVQSAVDNGSLEQVLGRVLGGAALDQVKINKFELREYLDWLDRRERYGKGKKPAAGVKNEGGEARSHWRGNEPGGHQVAYYRGVIIKETMSRLVHLMKNNNFDESTQDDALAMVEKLWKHPEANGLRLPEELRYARLTDGFRKASPDGLEVAKRWLKNYYHRHFPDFPRGVNQKMVGRMIRMARDGDAVHLQYESPYTKNSYKVFVSPDRTELWEDDKGYILVAHVYRTGREPLQTKFDESIEVNLLGLALLKGDAKKGADGRWYVNGQPDPRVMVKFHYMTRDLGDPISAAEVESHTAEVTSMIDRRQFDAEYAEWRAAKELENEKARILLKGAATRAVNKRAALAAEKRAAKPVKPAKAVKGKKS